MTVEEFLDLTRIEIFAASDHHVLDAADDVAIALIVDDAEIAGMHPAIRVEHVGGLFRLVPIAEHDAVAAGAEFAPRTTRHHAPFEIDDLDLDMRVDAADGRDAALQWVVGRALEADRAGFGHAVSDGDVAHVHLFIDALHHLDRT